MPGKARRVLHILARWGCFSIGTVYILIGVWAQLALLRLARPAADEERILHRLLDIPFGNVLIVLIAAGTFGYLAWRVYEVFADPYEDGGGFRGWVERITTGLGALTYGVLALSALKVLLGRGGHGEQSLRQFVGKALEWPAGPWLVGAAGLAVALTGLYQLKYVYDGGHRCRLHEDAMPAPVRLGTEALAWAGFFARCVILLVLGWLLVKAAWFYDPGAVGDTDSAFDFLGSNLPFGHKIFSVVAFGTIGYGCFMYLNGIFFRFRAGR